jgi:CheY-like chemotaxis protein
VEVRAEIADREARISVSDNGEGIAPDLLPHVFDRFRQADSSSRRRHGGLGLGLAIVHSLVELHGGRVWVESAGQGHGARFTVALPLDQDTRPEAVAARGGSIYGESLRDIRILVVDDEEDAVRMTERMFALEGAAVRTALGGAAALETVRSWRPDVLVLDIGMPNLDGYELLPRLRTALKADAASLPAVALTGFASASDSARAAAASFQAHVAKPFDMSAVCRLVARLALQARRPH